MTGGAPLPVELPEVTRVAEDLAAGRVGPEDLDDCLEVVLAGLRQRLGFDVTFVGKFESGRRTIRAVSNPEGEEVLPPGASDPLEDSYCARVADGRLPELVTDAREHPVSRQMPVTHELPVGTHLSVPIRLGDGHVYGTLCGFTRVPDPDLQARELGVMRLLAQLLSRHLENDRLSGPERDAARDEITRVIELGGPAIVFQPVKDLTTMAVVGYEALSRFEHGRPEDWFARAAAVGLGVELEVSAARGALARVPDIPHGAYLAVNLSAAAMCSEQVPAVLGGVDLTRVVVELTEQTGVHDYDEMRDRVAWLRRRGGRVAVDDAGAGYAGLQRILEMSPDVIKLDRGLVHDVDSDQARQAMVAALTFFARRTRAALVAEGVETRDEVRVLRELGVPLGQGFHLGRPEPLSA